MGRISNYSKLAIIGLIILIIGTSICDFFTYALRNYTVRGEAYTQTVGDLIYYISIDLCLMLWAICIRHKSRFEKLTKCVMQLAIDYFFWDMVFLCYTNPYEWNTGKIKIYGLSTITFLLIYYFEYVSLAHYYWVQKIKDLYHANFKNKSNGGKP